MAIAITLTPAAPPGLGQTSVAWTGLAATSHYIVTIVGPQGTQTFNVTSAGDGTLTTRFNTDGPGVYTFYTQLIGAVTAVPNGAFTIPSIG